MRDRRVRSVTVVAGIGLSVLLAGCGAANHPSATAPSSDSVVESCTAADIRVTLGKGDAATGSYNAPLRFTNTSERPCVIAGYPGVSYVAGEDAHQVGAPAERVPRQWRPITLAEGEVAHAGVRFLRVRNYEKAKCEPTPVRALRVYLPGETDPTLVPYSGTGCAETAMDGPQLMVKPVRPGPGGRR